MRIVKERAKITTVRGRGAKKGKFHVSRLPIA